MEIYRKTNIYCNPLVLLKACRNLDKIRFSFYFIYFVSWRLDAYFTPLGEFITGTEMLKSVNLSALTPFIMQDIRQPSDAMGGSLQLNHKFSQLPSARSPLESCCLSFSACPLRGPYPVPTQSSAGGRGQPKGDQHPR